MYYLPLVADEDLVLDQLAARLSDFYSLRNTDAARADELLDELGASTEIDRDIITELAAPKPLWMPERFLEAHTLAVRSLEVLDRNGTRRIPLPPLGPLTLLMRLLVQIVVMFIVRSYLSSVVDHLYRLYARREANCLPGDPQRVLLRRGRMDVERIRPGFKRNPLGVPTFLLGGVVVSGVVSLAQDIIAALDPTPVVNAVATVALFGLAVVASWVLMRGAAVARRRIELTTKEPIAALYQTIGRAGDPPSDHARTFAVLASLLVVLSLLVIPIGLTITVLS